MLLTFAIFVLTQSEAPPALTPGDLTACLGINRVAAAPEALGRTRSGLSPQQWIDACREAREADANRRAVVARVLDGVEAPGFGGVTRFIVEANAATDPLVAELFRQVARDQAARACFSAEAKATFALG